MQNPFNPVQQLLSLHSQGRFAEMEARARQLLRGNGNAPILNELLGVALSGQKKFRDALPYLQKAARREPNDALFWENLALCQRELGEYAHAEKSLRQSLKLKPGNVEALNALGSVLREQDRYEEAEDIFAQVLSIAPEHGPAHFNLGRLLVRKERLVDAEKHLRRALLLGHESAILRRMLGFVLMGLEQYPEAQSQLHCALDLDPGNYTILALLARVKFELGMKDEALSLVQKAFECCGNIKARLECGDIDGLDIFAEQLCVISLPHDALQILERTASFDNNINRRFLAVYAARDACRWDLSDKFEAWALDFGHDIPRAVNPFVPLYLAGATPEKQLIIARKYAAQFYVPPMQHRNVGQTSLSKAGSRRIRIGYLSADFRLHATSIILAGVIEAHDRDRFEITAYDHSPTAPDVYRERMMRAFDRFVPVHHLTPDGIARVIAQDDIDIMLDIKGWTRGTRSIALASKPAPVQIQWFGTPGTMGAPWIDYIVADHVVIPHGYEPFYSEKVLRLPDCYWPNDDRREVPSPLPRDQIGLPEGAFVFGCFNQSNKITPAIFEVWMRVLRMHDNSVMWLLSNDIKIREALRREAVSRGVDPERLIFAPFAPVSEHLARLANIDLALDCFPYTSHTTAVDALWMGVPLVGLSGETFASRVSESLLAAAGLGDLVARSYEEYFDLIIRLTIDKGALAAVKARVADCRKSVLFDTRRFTRALECGFELMWERHQRGLPPDHIDVPPVA